MIAYFLNIDILNVFKYHPPVMDLSGCTKL